MKKYTLVIVFVILIVAGAIYLDLLSWKSPAESGVDLDDRYAGDPFAAYRSSQGPFDDSNTNGIWGSVAKVYDLDQAIPAEKDMIDDLFLSVMSFHKGINVKPNGWQFENNAFLQAEFDRFYKHYGVRTAASMEVGELIA